MTHMYEYWLHDGRTNGVVYADKYVIEERPHEIYSRNVKEYVFYRGKTPVYRIPVEWTAELKKIK